MVHVVVFALEVELRLLARLNFDIAGLIVDIDS